ncbi:LysM peptidoglycan-binding domain-containing protein [Microcella sp.]|uniref:LysM peptidoglycan-binding domain-containing protein n=1 Tax=Microcella sp. TaxID=1913979 RepID=UPI003F70DA07
MSETDRAADTARSPHRASDSDERARAVFAGLTPRPAPASTTAAASVATATRIDLGRRARSSAFTTVPVALTGAIVLGLGLTGPIDPAHARKPLPPKPEQAPSPLGLRTALSQIGAALMPGGLTAHSVSTSAAPAVYTVAPGDTVSSIAQRFGISTASVLALNGLSWKSTIFPGQVLALTTAPVKTTGVPAPTTAGGRYTIVKGDTISAIAARFGISTQSLLDANGLAWTSIVYPGQALVIPGRIAEPAIAPAPVVGLAADAPADAPGPGVVGPGTPPADAVSDAGPGVSNAAAVAALAIVERPVLPVAPRRPAANPGSSAGPSPVRPPSGGTVTPLTAEMRTHASTIIQVGRQLGVPEYGIVIALATAMQESSLRNLSWGDRDSVGLFQQRPSSGWGTAADLQVPSHAARLFYEGRAGYTRGLLDIPGWQGMTLTRAAQAVQISAYPDHYAKWEASAWAWYFELT